MFSKEKCPFCNSAELLILAEDELTITIPDKYPASPGHCLVLTRRHVESFFDLSSHEISALFQSVFVARQRISAERHPAGFPAGFNVGVNQGVAAGQTVPHVHVHLIPRFLGDSPDPRGGIHECLRKDLAAIWKREGWLPLTLFFFMDTCVLRRWSSP